MLFMNGVSLVSCCYVSIVLFIQIYGSWAVTNNTLDWCDYIHNTPEPALIVYNRIPKCGSSTIQAFVDASVRNSDGRITAWHAGRDYWYRSFDTDDGARKRLYKVIRKLFMKFPNGTLVVDGHWNWHTVKQRSRKVGYMQMVRECEDRAQSSLTYSLFDSENARLAKSNGDWDRYLSKILKSNITHGKFQVCLKSAECLKKSTLRHQIHDGFMAKFFCAQNCMAQVGQSLLNGAIDRVAQPRIGYDVVGVLELMKESLEMYQCAFPSIFDDAGQHYASDPLHARVSKKPKQLPDALEEFEADACHPTDAALYEATKTIFLDRYEYMKQNWGKCCRGHRSPYN